MNDETTREALGRTVQALRSRRGLKRRDLAEAADLSYAYVSEIENGKKVPSTRVIAALAGALGLSAHELLRLAEELEPEVSADRIGRVSPTRSMPASRGSQWFHSAKRPPPAPMMADPDGPDPDLLLELNEIVRRLEHRDLQTLVTLARRLAGG